MAIHHKDAKFDWQEFKGNMRIIWGKYIEPKQKRLLGGIIVLNLMMLGFNVSVPMILAKIVDNLRQCENTLSPLLWSNWWAGMMFAGAIGLSIWIQRKAGILLKSILNKMRMLLAEKVFKTRKSIIEETGSAKIFERFTGDCWEISALFTKISSQLLRLLSGIGIYIAIGILNFSAFLICFVWSVISCVTCYYQTKGMNEADTAFRESKELVFKRFKDRISNACFIKMLGKKHYEAFRKDCFNDVNSSQLKAYEFSMKQTYVESTNEAIGSLMWINGVIYAGFMCFNGEISVGTALALLVYFNQTRDLYSDVSAIYERIRSANMAITRVLQLSNDESIIETFGEVTLENVRGEIELKNISFSYKDKEIFRDMSLHIHPGEIVYLIGKSGTGKSTLFNLITKMNKVDKGAIFIDGYEISTLSRSFRGHIYYDFQKPAIFTGSVIDNFKIVNPDVSDSQIENALRKVGLEALIPKLYDKDAILENASNLSGGEARRFVTARALVSDAKILLFDEPTANLDEESKRMILELIESLAEDHTILIIAHQLKQSELKNVRVVELDGEGGIVEK